MSNRSASTLATKTLHACVGLAGLVLAFSYPWDARAQDRAAESESSTQADRQLALDNCGFEEGDKAPSGWQQGAQVPGVTYIWDKKVGHKSKSSLCLKKTAKRFFPIAQWTQSVAHSGDSSKLALSALVKARQAHKAILDVQFLNADGKWSHEWAAYIGAKKAGDEPASHDWKRYSGTLSIPKGTQKIVIGLQIYGPGTVWFDDVKAEYAD
ncbi:MAG: hypothetical protein KKB50_12440 [Planctomycetes bacterium]|nr:hypothetical protein [Planctomycetota bacterium]